MDAGEEGAQHRPRGAGVRSVLEQVVLFVEDARLRGTRCLFCRSYVHQRRLHTDDAGRVRLHRLRQEV